MVTVPSRLDSTPPASGPAPARRPTVVEGVPPSVPAPAASSTPSASSRPYCAARCSGVLPSASAQPTSPPASSSALTTSAEPPHAASSSGGAPRASAHAAAAAALPAPARAAALAALRQELSFELRSLRRQALWAVALGRVSWGNAAGHPLAPALAGALLGFMLVGLFDSLVDGARIAFPRHFLRASFRGVPDQR